ncbi:RNase adapter RapZ [Aristophania vespae]|uniref:RNase adapter RapZ n=1 Tax=Aristophania vespae TaxID=2697033 RepID=UPI002351096C|nr:RNase adapter RapZ [Aristophania vespae]
MESSSYRSVETEEHPTRQILLVTGLSGAGKASILRILEDLDFEVVDNPPLDLFEALIARSGERLAIGIDVRSRGFKTELALKHFVHLRNLPDCAVQLIYATAEEDVLLRRFTATRRRHPLVSSGGILPGIEREIKLLAPLKAEADLVIDTSDLPLPELRHLIEARFGVSSEQGLSVVLMSFAYPAGLPREADMVFDVRFLKNPHYDERLRPYTGLEESVASYVKKDPFYDKFYEHLSALINLVLPRFMEEGKKYVTIAIGCSGGRHRSVTVVEALAKDLAEHITQNQSVKGPVMIVHRELARQGLTSWQWAVPPLEKDKITYKNSQDKIS